jgi:hypothetical protein
VATAVRGESIAAAAAAFDGKFFFDGTAAVLACLPLSPIWASTIETFEMPGLSMLRKIKLLRGGLICK